MGTTTPTAQPPRSPLAGGGRRRPNRRRFLVRRAVAGALALLLILFLSSYVPFMLQPTNESFGVRSVEWVREHGGAWLVSDIEAAWYSLTAPSKGGPALKKLPGAGGAEAAAAQARAYRPADVKPAIAPALPGEGVWHPASLVVRGAPTVYVTTLRSDRDYPRNVAGLAWIDASRTRLALYPGRYEPPGPGPRGPLEVPPAARYDLAATFNSGFKLSDAHGGGAFVNGHLFTPLAPGVATLTSDTSGHVDIRAWHGGPAPGPGIVLARQNLPLIVDNGRLNPTLSGGPEWGLTLGNKIRVWRSGIGIDRRGNLIYAAADLQTATSLADLLRRAGAVRAMELDINSFWVSLITYGPRSARTPANLLPNMSRPPSRYLSPEDRDFFAVFARGR